MYSAWENLEINGLPAARLWHQARGKRSLLDVKLESGHNDYILHA
jgi:hypothetical protein